MGKSQKKREPEPRKETRETLEWILKESGVEPKPNVVKSLLLFFVKSNAKAKRDGFRLRKMAEKD